MGLHWFYRSNSGNINFNRNPSMNMVFIFIYLSFQCLLIVFYSIFSRGYILVHILFFLFTDMWSFKNDTVKVCSVHLSLFLFCIYGMFWENSIETSILSRMKQITSPGWMHETSAQGWCTRKTQRDGMGREREVGGGIEKGNTCKSMADSCQCMAKYFNIVISLQLIKIMGKKMIL